MFSAVYLKAKPSDALARVTFEYFLLSSFLSSLNFNFGDKLFF